MKQPVEEKVLISKELDEMQKELDKKKVELDRIEAKLVERERKVEESEAKAKLGFAKLNTEFLEELKKDKDEIIAKFKMEIDRERKSIVAKEDALMQKEAQCNIREETVLKREKEADLGFVKKNKKAIAELKVEQEKIIISHKKKFDEIEKELDAEREKRLKELEESLHRYEKEALSEIEIQKQALAKEEKRLETLEKDISKREDLLDAEENKVKLAQRRIRMDERLVSEERASLIQEAEKIALDRVKDIQKILKSKEEFIEFQSQERSALESKINHLEEINRRFGDKSPDEVFSEMNRLKKEISRLKEELSRRADPSIKDERDQLLSERDEWQSERLKITQQLERLKKYESVYRISISEKESLRDEKEAAERRSSVLELLTEQYDEKVKSLKSLYEQPQELEKRISPILSPVFTKEELRNDGNENVNEVEWLNDINEKINESGLRFSKRILNAFHTSLKTAEWSPISVLAGVSGTGKSELPRLYSRFGGILFQSESVQPNWDSPQSLFGFFNSVDNRFNATELLRALVQSQYSRNDENYQQGSGFNDHIMLVLLDEMNLAYVELYFSDLLSKLELRRGDRNVPEIGIDIGAGIDPYKLKLGRNVLWTGTMNQDETTKSLSDKVIDRSNIITFPRPKALISRRDVKLAEPRPLLSIKAWEKWQSSSAGFTEKQILPYRELLEEMNLRLSKSGRALGHRVWQSMENYMINHPEVISAQQSNDEVKLDRAMKLSFEDQIAQKVMPKLRGIETSGVSKSETLDPVKKLLEDFGLNLTYDFELASKSGYGQFIWNSANYIEIE